MNQPTNLDPVEWAKYNTHMQRRRDVAELICGAPLPELQMLPDHDLENLLVAVNRAASELQGQGEKSDRIALQLLTALGRFEAAR